MNLKKVSEISSFTLIPLCLIIVLPVWGPLDSFSSYTILYSVFISVMLFFPSALMLVCVLMLIGIIDKRGYFVGSPKRFRVLVTLLLTFFMLVNQVTFSIDDPDNSNLRKNTFITSPIINKIIANRTQEEMSIYNKNRLRELSESKERLEKDRQELDERIQKLDKKINTLNGINGENLSIFLID